MDLSGKKILVTGGSGFIGTNLIKKLTSLGASVTNFDLANGQDIENENQLAAFIRRKYDIIYHLAGFSGSTESNKERLKSFRINTLATVNLCQQVLKYSPKTKIIISSSRLEYGKPQYLPVDENHPIQPTSAYGLSKLAATQTALIFHKINNFDVTIFRTSNVYGLHKDSKFAGYNIINHFIDLAQRDQTLTIFGAGVQKRDYLFIDDLVNAFVLAANQSVSSGQIYNLGAGVGIKFKEMVELIVKKIGKGKIKFVKWPKDAKVVETGDYITDLTKIKRELGFAPKIGFEEGIQKTINHKL